MGPALPSMDQAALRHTKKQLQLKLKHSNPGRCTRTPALSLVTIRRAIKEFIHTFTLSLSPPLYLEKPRRRTPGWHQQLYR